MNKKKIMQKIRQAATNINGKIKFSKRGVPYVLFSKGGTLCSVCYFSNTDKFRVFYPWNVPGEPQTRLDFKTAEEIQEWQKQ